MIVATCAAFAPTLRNRFILDDDYIVVQNAAIRATSNIPGFFVSTPPGPINRNYYRPVMLASFAVDHALFGLEPAGYHATNIALHAACALLVYWLLLELTLPKLACLWGGLLFALHPVQGEVVYLVNYRGASLSTLCFLLAWICHVRSRAERRTERERWLLSALIGMLYFCSMAAKEIGVTLPVALWLADLLVPTSVAGAAASRHSHIRAYAVCVLTLGSYFALRHALCEPQTTSYFGTTPAATVLRSMLVVEAYACLLIVFPHNLAGTYDGSYLAEPTQWSDPRLLCALLVLGAIVLLWLRMLRVAPRIALGLGLFFVTQVPTLQWVRLPVLFGERFLYLPLVGVCIATADLVARLQCVRWRGLAYGALSALCAVCAWQNHARAADWSSEESFWRATVNARPASLQAHVGLAIVLARAGHCDEALPHYRFALDRLSAAPADRSVFGESASCYSKTHDQQGARAVVRRWLVLHPSDVGFQRMLARLDGPSRTVESEH
jgi:hypothetical protein